MKTLDCARRADLPKPHPHVVVPGRRGAAHGGNPRRRTAVETGLALLTGE
ncbi:hypothetical protein [Roseovarius spongiae]|nr:hypothetical protein [Roseovarius spongiae]